MFSYPTVLEIPVFIQNAAKKIFSKYEVNDIKEWSKKYLLLYSQNHANEPPLDLTKLKKIKFGNSEELKIKTKLFGIDNHKDNHLKGLDGNTGKNNDGKDYKDTQTIDVNDEEKIGLSKQKENVVSSYLKIEYTPFSIGYLYCRFPYTYSIISRILTELKTRNPKFKPVSVLDYGAGLGSGILASIDVFNSDRLLKLACVEPNKYMRKLGKFIVNESLMLKDEGNTKEVVWVDSIAMLPGTGGMERGKFDLIVLSHVLQELRTSSSREMLIDMLYGRLSNQGVIVVVEPGSPKGYRFINDIREWVIEKREKDIDKNNIDENENKEINIIAPCPHSNTCPLASNPKTWCHFSQSVRKYNKDIIARVRKDDDLTNEKYSYVVIKKGSHILNSLKTDKSSINYNDSELSLAEQSYTWSRVIRPSIKKQKHVILDVCTTQGKMERRIIASSHGKDEGMKIVKRIKWGDLWMFNSRMPNRFRKERTKAKRLF